MIQGICDISKWLTAIHLLQPIKICQNKKINTNYESNLEPLCSLLGEQGCWMAMTRAAYEANQWSLAPQWHPSRWIGAPVATINQTCRKAPVPAAKPHAPSRRAVRNASEQGNVEWMEYSEQARSRLR